jgi:hypothetical protein
MADKRFGVIQIRFQFAGGVFHLALLEGLLGLGLLISSSGDISANAIVACGCP